MNGGPRQIRSHRFIDTNEYRSGNYPQRSTAHIWAGVLIVLGMFAAAVALARAGWSPESITGLLVLFGTLSSAVLIAVGKLTTIEKSTQTTERQT